MSVNASTTAGADALSLAVGFILNFLATLGGVAVAFLLTFWDERRRKRLEKRIFKDESFRPFRPRFRKIPMTSKRTGPSLALVA